MSKALGKSLKQIQDEQMPLFSLPQAARTHDPETSHIAAEKVTASGKREAACKIIFAVLKETDGLTSKEIAAQCELDRHCCARRMTDLEYSNLIRRGKKRTCTVDGGQALDWWIVKQYLT